MTNSFLIGTLSIGTLSSLIVSKRISILESEINKFVSSANTIGVSLLELLKRLFIYFRNKSGPRMEPVIYHK